MSAAKKKNSDEVMYYLENGLAVFTAAYLLKRGTCCRCGCRHCPYGLRENDNGKSQSDNDSLSKQS